MRFVALVALTGIGACMTSLLPTPARADDAPATDERGIQLLVRGVYLQAHRPVLDRFVPETLNGKLYPEFSIEIRPLPGWSTELAVGMPTDFGLSDGFYDVRLMPITWTVKHVFAAHSTLRPYAGVGLDYTTSSLVANTLGLSHYVGLESKSVGWAVQAGLNAQITRGWFLNADIRYLGKMEPQGLFQGMPSGERYVINPFLIGVGIGYRWTVPH